MTRILIAVLICVTFCFAAVSSAVAQGVKVGDTPKYSLKTLDGQTLTNASLRGRIVVLDFWASWCGPCMAIAPQKVKAHAKYREKGVVFVGISLDSDPAALRRAIKEKGFIWPQSCDVQGWKGAVVKQFGVRGIPAAFILAPNGAVVWTGGTAGIDAALADAVEKYPVALTPEQKLEEAVKRVTDAGKLVNGEEKDRAGALKLVQDVPTGLLREDAVVAVADPLVAAFKIEGPGDEAKAIRDALRDNREGARVVEALTRAHAAAKRRAEREEKSSGDEKPSEDNNTKSDGDPVAADDQKDKASE